MIKLARDLNPGDEIRWWNETMTVEGIYTDSWGYTKLNLSGTIGGHLVHQDTRLLVVGNMADEVERFLAGKVIQIEEGINGNDSRHVSRETRD